MCFWTGYVVVNIKEWLFLTGTESNLPYSPGYTESQVIEVIATFAWLMF